MNEATDPVENVTVVPSVHFDELLTEVPDEPNERVRAAARRQGGVVQSDRVEPFPSLSPFPRTPAVETRITMPMELLPREGLLSLSAQGVAPAVDVTTRFPDGVTGRCPACREQTSAVVSLGVQLAAANIAQPYRGPVDVVLEGSRPRRYRLEPCGCELELR